MRIAFYAPLKPPTHPSPSGDRRVARLLMQALGLGGHRVELASTLRSFDATGDPERQASLREHGTALARALAARWQAAPRELRPQLWFTYHVYYKAPDWLGPPVSAALGIPYVIAEPSFASKRAGGPWHVGHEATRDAIGRAALLLCATRDDVVCVEAVAAARDRVQWLPPFLDATPFSEARRAREAHRTHLAARHRLDPSAPWIVVAAMMRPGDKLASYRALGAVLAQLGDLPWQVVIAGDGPARAEVAATLESAAPGRCRFLGELGLAELAAVYAACDLCVWPAVNEAYGMAMLEAQAAGVPAVSSAQRGVPDVVEHGHTGLLAPPGDDAALAGLVRELLGDPSRRTAMGKAAAEFAGGERGMQAATARLQAALAGVP